MKYLLIVGIVMQALSASGEILKMEYDQHNGDLLLTHNCSYEPFVDVEMVQCTNMYPPQCEGDLVITYSEACQGEQQIQRVSLNMVFGPFSSLKLETKEVGSWEAPKEYTTTIDGTGNFTDNVVNSVPLLLDSEVILPIY